MDEVVGTIVGLGIPGLIFYLLILAAPVTGGAAIVWALSAFGPGGMIGGLISLGASVAIITAVATYGSEKVTNEIMNKFYQNGYTKQSIISEIKSYPIPDEFKKLVLEELEEDKEEK